MGHIRLRVLYIRVCLQHHSVHTTATLPCVAGGKGRGEALARHAPLGVVGGHAYEVGGAHIATQL